MKDETTIELTINSKLTDIYTKSSIYDDIINNILNDRNLKRELLSEISIYILENKEKIYKVIKDGYFKYWFIRVVMNQVNSKTSPFFKNNKMSCGQFEILEWVDYKIDTSEDDIREKRELDKLLNYIENIREEVKTSWFNAEVFKMYYDKGMSYRDIENETGIDHVAIWKVVTKTKKELINKINKEGI